MECAARFPAIAATVDVLGVFRVDTKFKSTSTNIGTSSVAASCATPVLHLLTLYGAHDGAVRASLFCTLAQSLLTCIQYFDPLL